LAERAKLSERTVRNLEAGRVRSPRNDTVRLLADALRLTGPEREGWFDAARHLNGRRPEPAAPEVRGLERESKSWRRRSFTTEFKVEAVLTDDVQDAFCLEVTWLPDRAGKIVLAVHCAYQGAARCPTYQLDVAVCPARQLSARHLGCLFLVGSRHQFLGRAAPAGVHPIIFDNSAPAR
jgi:transcriptional regulator with XRE-family HTH domain